MHRVAEGIYLNVAAEYILLAFAEGCFLLLQRGVGFLELFAKLLQLAFAAEEVERLFLQAAAAHGAAGADDVALERCDMERAAGAVLQRDARVEVLDDDRAAQQVIHHVSHVVVAVDELVRHADAAGHVEKRPLFARDARGVE